MACNIMTKFKTCNHHHPSSKLILYEWVICIWIYIISPYYKSPFVSLGTVETILFRMYPLEEWRQFLPFYSVYNKWHFNNTDIS